MLLVEQFLIFNFLIFSTFGVSIGGKVIKIMVFQCYLTIKGEAFQFYLRCFLLWHSGTSISGKMIKFIMLKMLLINELRSSNRKRMLVEQIFFIFLFFSCLGPPPEREYRNQFLGICSSSEENENKTKKTIFISIYTIAKCRRRSREKRQFQRHTI